MKITGYWRPLGLAHRSYQLSIIEPGEAIGWMEDDFHHFGVRIQYSSNQVTSVAMMSPRTPWSTCSGADKPLQDLVGSPLITRASDIGKLIDMRQQCTHVFDLAGLLLAHIGNRRLRSPHRRYLSAVEDRPVKIGADFDLKSFGQGKATLYQDGLEVLSWMLDQDTIVSPDAHSGIQLGNGFRGWSETLAETEAEQVTILRRAASIAIARAINTDDYPTASDMSMEPLCYSFQAERSHVAKRHFGNAKDYSTTPDSLLSNLSDEPN